MNTTQAQDLVTSLLSIAGFQVDSVAIDTRGEGDYYLNILVPEHAPLLIGKGGETLRSLQHLLKNAFRVQGILADEEMLKVDLDAYRAQQESNVLDMVSRRAEEVLKTGRDAHLPPMSGFFRRLVHLHVKEKFPTLQTVSQGSGNDRAVMICLQDSESARPSVPDEAPTDIYSEIEF